MTYDRHSHVANTKFEPSVRLLTIHEVASKLRVDDTTVRRWINNGILEAVTLPHAGKRCGYRVKESTLEKLMSKTNLTK